MLLIKGTGECPALIRTPNHTNDVFRVAFKLLQAFCVSDFPESH